MNDLGKRMMWGAITGIVIVLGLSFYSGVDLPFVPPGPPRPLTIVGVYESRDLKEYTPGQRAWIQGEPFAKKMKDDGHAYYVVDKDIKDKDDERPADLVPFLDAAKEKTLPVLTTKKPGNAKVNVYEPKSVEEAKQAVKDAGG